MTDPAVIESDAGPTQLIFTISRRGDTSGTVTLDWTTVDDTAIAASDYVADFGQLVFSDPGVNQQIVTVVVNGDANDEPDETLHLDLTLAAGAALIADSAPQGVILNDDTKILIDDVMVTEGDQTTRFIDAFVTNHSRQGQLLTLDTST